MAIDVEALYRRYGPMVLRRCRRLLGDDEKALDAMQDVFVQLLRFEERLQESAPSSLLFRIATNVCLNKLRSQRRRPEDASDLVAEIARASDDEPRSSARLMLARLFGVGLDNETTAAIAVMHWVDGMTHEEVAREVGMSVSGVRKRLRALQGRLALQLEVPA